MLSIKIVVVDDEVPARNMIKTLLEEIDGYEVVGDFSNGLDAREWVSKNQVDIILCDMNMPQINGIDFIKSIKAIHSDIQFIAISAYDSFNYVHGCMLESVSDYLLKHELSKKKLIDTLDRVKEINSISPKSVQIKGKVGYSIKQSHDFNSEYINCLIDKNEIDFSLNNIIPIKISIDYKPKLNERMNEIVKATADILRQIIGSSNKYIYHVDANRNIDLLLGFENVKSNLSMVSSALSLCSKLNRRVKLLLDVSITCCVGNVVSDLSEALNNYSQLKRKLESKLYLGGDRVFSVEDNGIEKYGNYKLSDETISYLYQDTINMEETDVLACIRDVFREVKSVRADLQSVINVARTLILIPSKISSINFDYDNCYDELEFFDVCESIEKYILDIYKSIFKLIRKNELEEYTLPVQKTLLYIFENYKQDISLDSCCDEVGLSYSHLSRLIKKETGKGFVEHLKIIRINKAKAFILKGDRTTKQIVDDVGFYNYNYFFKVFKENENISPTDFAVQHKKV